LLEFFLGDGLSTAVNADLPVAKNTSKFDLDRNPIATRAHERKNSGWIGGWKREPQE
jgi:hypothetical protein